MTKPILLRLGLVILAAGAVFAATVVALAVPGGMLDDLGSGEPAPYNFRTLERRSFIYDAGGNRLSQLRADVNREPVELADIPPHVVNAIVAVEDAGFWSHDGIDARGLIRAFSVNVGGGDVSQGGSTITQQLVKLDVLQNRGKTLERKVQEIVIARRIERELTKEEILTRYLNSVYFGAGAYGIEAAAETFYGKSARDLDIAEGALLAGLIRSPGAYDPKNYPERAARRRGVVLDRMMDEGLLNQAEADFINTLPVPQERQQIVPPPNDYFVEEVKLQLLDEKNPEFAALGATEEERKAAVFTGGLRIFTTFDPNAQALALAARDNVIGNGGLHDTGQPATKFVDDDGNPDTPAVEVPDVDEAGNQRTVQATASLVSVEPGTGAIRAMVGGPGFDQYRFNIATQGFRHNGSSFKPIVLATLLDNGISPDDLVDGTAPCTFDMGRGAEDYVANNAEPGGGWQSITEQTVGSVNCAYLRLGLIVGLDNVRAVADRLGISPAPDVDGNGEPDAPAPSMPLGTQPGSVVEMAGAFAAFANDGVFNSPYYIDRIEDASGRVIYAHQHQPSQAISADAARITTSILEQGVIRGTGTRARLASQPAAGKTGTDNDFKNGWFVGFTPYLSTAVWVGGMTQVVPVENIPMGSGRLFGGTWPAMIWKEMMAPYHDGREVIGFPEAPSRPGGKLLTVPGGRDLTQTPPPGSEPPPPECPPFCPPPSFPITIPSLPLQPPGQGGGGGGGGGRTTTSAPTATTIAPPITLPRPDDGNG